MSPFAETEFRGIVAPPISWFDEYNSKQSSLNSAKDSDIAY